MKNLNLYTSNRLENLVQILGEILQPPLSSPMIPEIIIVQSKGMERWVSMELARQHKICANICFPYPNAFIYDLFKNTFGKMPDKSPFEPHIMTWKIMKLLPDCINDKKFRQLKNYLGETKHTIKHYQVSEKIAQIFDQYLLFRPEWILNWENNKKDSGWQSELWKKLVQGNENLHRPALHKAFIDNLDNNTNLPERISVFGISTLPKFHMDIFNAISQYSQVNMFLLNPCIDYWGDLMNKKEKRNIIRRAAAKGQNKDELYIGSGNSLLASMGMLGRDFFDMINDYDPGAGNDFQEPGHKTLLSAIQSDIYHRTDRPSELVEIMTIDNSDYSICIHSCHSPMREIEVLHDNLLDMFENNSNLMPSDVIVMTPDIEIYAPYIQGVFDVSFNDPRKIPFSIADRGIRMESRIIDAFFNILDLTGSRFGAAQVLSIIESPGIYKKFGLSENNMDQIRQWVRDTRIRWGVDNKNKNRLGLPELSENTWKAGLDRLMLGYAMTGNEEQMFNKIVPYDNIEGTQTIVLGQFMEFIDLLFKYVRAISHSRSLSKWAEIFRKIIQNFFYSDQETEKEIQIIRDALSNLADMEKLSGFQEKLDINIVKSYLNNQLNKDPFGFGFITGGITFCSMIPMRSIPFKIICLIGINSNSYPRNFKPPGFDLMAENPRPGDRTRRNDDRYLFLESLLSAREKFYISYVGQSIKDNSIIPPSVLVSELIDYINQGFKLADHEDINDHIVTKHRLQGFNPVYFNGNQKLFSYSKQNYKAAKCMYSLKASREPFILQKLSKPDDTWKNIDIKTFCNFFANPARFIMNQRIGVYLEESDENIEEKEAFDIKGLEKYAIEQTLVKKHLKGHDLNDFYVLKKQIGQLPHGIVGQCCYEKICQNIKGFIKKIEPYIDSSFLEPLDLNIAVNGFNLTGQIDKLYSERQLFFRCAAIKTKDIISAWIYHLALNAVNKDKYPVKTLVAGTDDVWEYSPVENSLELLENLLNQYWQGLQKPLEFFPKSSQEYAKLIANGKSCEEALIKSQNIWEGSEFSSGEITDSYFHRCFSHCNPFHQEFQSIALGIFGPIFDNRKKV